MLGLMLMMLFASGPTALIGVTPGVTAQDIQSSIQSASPASPRSTQGTQSHRGVRLGAEAAAYFSQFKAADTAVRKSNAALIVSIGLERGFKPRSCAIAVATSIQETGLRNLNWGDADSKGLFQQRPSVISWGTAAQIMQRSHAINQFYDRLLWYPYRDTRPMIETAIRVQRPNPTFYHRDWKWDTIATEIVEFYSASKGG